MIILAAFLYCSITISIQIIIWNIHKPNNELKIILLYLIIFPIFLFLNINLHLYNTKLILQDIILYFLFAYSFNALYFITFFGIKYNSPSLLLVYLIHIDKNNNINHLKNNFIKTPFIEKRLSQLLKDGIVIKSGNQFLLTSRGEKIYRVTSFLKKIFNIQSTT